MHANSRLIFQKQAVPFFRPNKRVLEIGPDAIPSTYRQCLQETHLEWETLDMRRADKAAAAGHPRLEA